MEESDGVFAKRRRNVIIVGVVICILAIVNPDIEKIKLFEIEFDFTNKNWLIWLGLTIWFLYAFMRVFSYFNTYIGSKKESRRQFIYWGEQGSNYWLKELEDYRKELEPYLINESPSSTLKFSRLLYSSKPENQLSNWVSEGVIPGECTFRFTVEYNKIDEGNPTEQITRTIIFQPNSEYEKYFNQRKWKYTVQDDWWEYNVLWAFIIVAFGLLIWGWIQSFI